jgi:heme-degrading monooxygenase HmoA
MPNDTTTTVPTYHLAQLNIGRIRGPMDSPIMADFVARLDAVNALADAAPGFVWRLQTEDGNATAIRPYDDDRIAVNMSVWESADALHAFVYRGDHIEVMRRRREWFERMEDAYVVLWWVPAGHRPSVAEAVARLEALRRDGPTPHAFTFRRLFPAPNDADAAARELPDACPA